MANNTETQKPKERVKYKFGQSDIDLTNYIHNLGTNVQSYLNSKNWNDGQKQEFMNAYNRYLTGLQDQLANNTNRFTTDDFGSIIDSTGALSNTDNDDIDPVGSEYYYDDKGNRITTDDFNALKKRKQKNYNTFSANREVATYFNAIGNALRSKQPTKEQTSNAFDLSKHGFLADWTRINNPAGGNLNLDPYLEKDAVDEATGKRGTTNRAAYLKEQIENYINNIGDYDFSSTPFKDRNTYVSRLRAAAENLGNGYNSEDVIALNQAGIGNEFLSKFFSTGAEEPQAKQSELERQAEQSAQELAQRRRDDELRAVIEEEKQDQYNRQRDAFFADYQKQNPFNSTIKSQAIALSYNPNAMYDRAATKYGVDRSNTEALQSAVKEYINFPQLAAAIRGKEHILQGQKDVTAAHIANNLDWAAQSNLLTDKIGDTGYYIVPGSENYDNWSYIAYNPITRHYEEQSMLLNEELKKKMAYAEYDRRNKDVQKHQLGGLLKYTEEYQKKAQKEAEKQQRIDQKVEETGKTREQVEAAERRPIEEGFSTIDKVRLGTAAADAISAAAAFIPGYGTVASGVLGIGSTLTNIGADIADESMSGWDVAGNALYGLGMDVVGLIPGMGATGKAAKIVRVLKPVSKLAMRTLQAYGMVHSADAFNKLMSNPSDMSADDWRNLVTGLQAISGEARYKGGKRAVSRATTQRDVADVKTSTGRMATISKEDLDKLRETKGLKAQNKLFSELTGGQKLQREFKGREFNWKQPWKSRLHSDNPEFSTRTESTFLPEDTSWDARLFRGMQKKEGNSNKKPSQQTTASNFDRLRNRPLPHKQSNKKKKTSRDDRRTVKREEGGILDRVRKFDGGGITETARKATQYALNNNWFTNLYNQKSLTGWDSSKDASKAGVSITNQNASHGNAGDLSIPFYKNLMYTSQSNLVGQDLQSYYNSAFQGKSLEDYVNGYNANAAKIRGYWDQERAYRQAGASEHNRLFRNMFGNRSNNSNDVWNIGYDPKLDDVVGSSTWLRRMDRYEKEFDALSDEEKKARVHKIDLGGGNVGYVYKKANGDIAIWNEPVAPEQPTEPAKPASTTTVIGPEQPKKEGDTREMFSFLRNINPTIAYGLPRAVYADRMNRRMTDLAKASVTPLLKDPFQVHRYTRSDLDAEMQGERNYANLRRLASRPITSDGSLQTATQLQAEVQGQEARTAGKEKSNQTQRQYDELAWQQEKENAANRHETAMFNRAQQWGADQDKSKFEQAYLSKKFNIWDTFGQQLEYDARTKQQENKALADNFARSDIHNAVNYAPNDYGANLTPEELTVWNKVLSGTNPSSLSTQEFNSYRLAAQKVSRIETDQLRQHYNIPNTRWSGKAGVPNTPWSASISFVKKGGIISAKNGSKIAVAGIEAKTADAERFQKQIKDCIDRNEKTLDRLSKSLYGLIKASMIK